MSIAQIGGYKYQLNSEECAELFLKGISRQTYINRIACCGWQKEKALKTKKQHQRTFTDKQRALMKKNGLSSTVVSQRYRRGWDENKIFTIVKILFSSQPRRYR